jgi:hypothetical protein
VTPAVALLWSNGGAFFGGGELGRGPILTVREFVGSRLSIVASLAVAYCSRFPCSRVVYSCLTYDHNMTI